LRISVSVLQIETEIRETSSRSASDLQLSGTFMSNADMRFLCEGIITFGQNIYFREGMTESLRSRDI